MFSKKFTGILLTGILLAGVALTFSRCYDDSEARVTIHLERKDLTGKTEVRRKFFIDSILELFSQKAEASAGWDSTQGPLTLTISGNSMETLIYNIPQTETNYSVIIPATSGVKFEIFSTTASGAVSKNWGGATVADLVPGENSIKIQMLPMTIISSFYPVPGSIPVLYVYWESSSASVTSYKIYRASSPEGLYSNIGSSSTSPFIDSTGASGVLYYYRISTISALGESTLCDYSSYVFPLQI